MTQYASHVAPNRSYRDKGRSLLAYRFTAAQFDFVDENIRHEGRAVEARMSLAFSKGGLLTAVWPAPRDNSVFDVLNGGDAVVSIRGKRLNTKVAICARASEPHVPRRISPFRRVLWKHDDAHVWCRLIA